MSVGNGTCDREDLRIALGALALDALDPEEAREVRRHMAGCAACQAEYASFVGVRNILDAGVVGGLARAQTQPAGAVDGTRVPDDRNGSRSGIGGVPTGTRGPASGRPPRGPGAISRSRRFAVSAMAGTSALVLAAVMFFVGRDVGTNSVAQPPPVTISKSPPRNALPAVTQNGITAEIRYQGVGWGTWVQATVTGVPANKVCTLTVYDAKGEEHIIGSWGSVPGQTLVIPAAAVLKPSEIMRFDVKVSGDGGYDIEIPMA